MTRRDVLRLSTAAALAVGLPAGWRGAAYASDAPEHPKMRFGIIALTDCSSIVMAHELLTGTPGVGGFLWQEYNSLVYSHIILSVITIGAIGLVLGRLMGLVEARVKAG